MVDITLITVKWIMTGYSSWFKVNPLILVILGCIGTAAMLINGKSHNKPSIEQSILMAI